MLISPAVPARRKSLQEIIAFNERNKDKEMPYFGQDLFVRAQAKGPLTSQRISGRAGSQPSLLSPGRY